MSSKDSKSVSPEPEPKKPVVKKSPEVSPEPELKKSVVKKPPAKKAEVKKPVKILTFQGREVEIVDTTKSRKGKDWDLLDLKFLGEDTVFRIKRRALDK